jgi:hypothetical protein
MIYFPTGQGNLNPLFSSCSGKVDESSLHINPYSLNANSLLLWFEKKPRLD